MTKEKESLSLVQKAFWGVGGFAENLANNTFSTLAYLIFSIGMGISPFYIGLAQSASRVIDAVTDPMMGAITDNTKSRWGRRRPWIFIGAILMSLTFYGIWYTTQLEKGFSVDKNTRALWHFDAADPHKALDATEHDNTGFIHKTTFVDTEDRTTLYLAGHGEGVEIPSPFTGLQKAFTIEMFINPIQINREQYLFNHKSGTDDIGISFTEDEKLQFAVKSGKIFPKTFTVISEDSLHTNQWQHIAAVFSEGKLLLYMNGTLQGQCNMTTTPEWGETAMIGRSMKKSDPGSYYGLMDDIRISGIHRYGQQSGTELMADRLTLDSNTVALWPCERSTDGLMDSGPDHLHGKILKTVKETSGKFKKSLYLSGYGEYLKVPALLTGIQKAFTIEMYAKSPEYAANTGIFTQETEEGGVIISTSGKNQLNFRIIDTAGTAHEIRMDESRKVHSDGNRTLLLAGNGEGVTIESPFDGIQNEFTIEMNVLSQGNPSDEILFCHKSGRKKLLLGLDEEKRVQFEMHPGGIFNTTRRLVSRKALSPGVWQHLAVTFEGSEMSIYIDGQPEGRKAASLNMQWDRQPSTTSIGMHPNATETSSFRGQMDDILISNKIRYHDKFNPGTVQPDSSRICFWKCDGTRDKLIDEGEQKNHGQIMKSTLKTDQWNHIAAVFERPYMRLFLNGKLYNQDRLDADVHWGNTASSSFVGPGEKEKPVLASFSGSVDELRISDCGRYANDFSLVKAWTPIYLVIIVSLFYMAFTIWVVPYSGMGLELAVDYNERTQLMIFRVLPSFIIGIFIASLYKITRMDHIWGGNEVTGAYYVGAIVAALMLVTSMTPALFCKERFAHTQQKKFNMIRAIGQTLKEKPFLLLIGSVFFVFVALFFMIPLLTYISLYHVCQGNKDLMATIGMYTGFIQAGTQILSMFAIGYFAKFFDKKKVLITGLTVGILGYLSSWLLFTPQYPFLTIIPPVIINIGLCACWVLNGSFSADICDLDELNSGMRREGMYSSVFGFLNKLAIAFVSAVSAWVLVKLGFEGDNLNPTEGQLFTLRWFYIVVPVISMLAAIFCMWKYPLTKEKVQEIQNKLKEIRGTTSLQS